MLVQVLARYADTCGDEVTYPFGVFETPSVEAAEQVFPHGFFCGWKVEPFEMQQLPAHTPVLPDESEMRRMAW